MGSLLKMTGMKQYSPAFVCNRMREIQYKILHSSHMMPFILNRMGNWISPLCIKCNSSIGTYIHCFWECHMIKRCWSSVAQELSKIFSLKVSMDSGLFILGLPWKALSLSRLDFKLCDKLLFLARRCILGWWISDKPPMVTQWYQEMFKVLPLERLLGIMVYLRERGCPSYDIYLHPSGTI